MKTIFEGKNLYAVIIAFLLMITFFITFYIIRNHYQYVFKNVITENTLTANLLSSLMYEHQKAATSILESYAHRPLFIDAVKKKDFHRALYHLKSLSEHHTEIDALFITDKSGTLWANYPVDKTGFGKNLAYRDWYKGVSKKWRPYISTVFRLIVLEKGLAVALSVPVLDRKGKVIGILSGAHRTAFLAAFLKGNIIDPQKSITLLDQEGNIIFSNAVPYQEKITKYLDARVLEKALAGVTADMEVADAKEKGSISYVSIAPVKGMGWSVIVGQEKNAILKSLYRYFILSAVAGFVIFLFLAVSLLYFRKEYKYRKTKELLQAGVALRESDEIFSQFMNYSPVYVFFKDENIKSIRLSKNYAEMLGRPISELLGKNMDDIFPSDLAKSMVADDKRILKEGKKFEIEEEMNGRFYSTIKFPICREGKPAYLAGFTVDITERKQAEEALKISESLHREAQAAAHIGHWELDTSIMTPRWSEEIFHIFGLDPEKSEPSFSLHEKITHPDDWDILNKAVTTSIAEGTPFNIEFRIVRPDNTIRWMHATGHPRKDSQGRIERLFGTAQDITDRKLAEEEKRRLEERSRKVVEDIFRFIPEGVLVFSRKMELLRQNQAFRELVSGYAGRLGFVEDELENLIIDKVKAGLRDSNIKEIKIARKHKTREQT